MIEKFVKEIIYEIPDIETEDNTNFIKLLNEILCELEFEDEFLKELESLLEAKKSKNKNSGDKIENFNNSNSLNIDSLGRGSLINAIQKTPQKKTFLKRQRKRSLADKSDYSPNRDREDTSNDKDLKKNYTIENFFKPVNKNSTFHSELFKNNCKDNTKKANSTNSVDINKYNFNSSIFNKFINHNNTQLTYTTYNEDSTHSLNPCPAIHPNTSSVPFNYNQSFYKQNTAENYNVFPANTTLSEDSTMKRPYNLNLSNNTPCYRSNYFSSGGKSTDLSVSEFSLYPKTKARTVVGDNSSLGGDDSFSSSQSQININIINNNLLKFRGGINSRLANTLNVIPRTKKQSVKGQIRTNSSKKKKANDKFLMEKLIEKFSSIRKDSTFSAENIDFNKSVASKESSSCSYEIKKLVNNEFYKIQNEIQTNLKSPVEIAKFESIINNTDSTLANTGTSKTSPVHTKLQNKKKNCKRMLNSKSNTKSMSSEIGTNRKNRKLSEDEVLAYRTPVKQEKITTVTSGKKVSPKTTTRRNLTYLFQQIK